MTSWEFVSRVVAGLAAADVRLAEFTAWEDEEDDGAAVSVCIHLNGGGWAQHDVPLEHLVNAQPEALVSAAVDALLGCATPRAVVSEPGGDDR